MRPKRRWAAAAAAVTAALALVFASDALWMLEYRLQDTLFQRPSLTDPDIAVLGIDERALAKFGRFQDWNRQIMADAINILNSDPDAKPAVIAIDVLYTEEGADKQADQSLAEAARNGGNVIAGSQVLYGFRNAITAYYKPYPELALYAGHGLVNGSFDEDYVIRTALLKTEYEGETLYSLPAQIFRKYTGAGVPLSQMYIPYYGEPGDYYQGSIADIFEPDFDPSFYQDCIVMIGAYADGLMDAFHTPVGGQMYGVEIHANAVQALIEGGYKTEVPFGARLAGCLCLIALALALALLLDVRILAAAFPALAAVHLLSAVFLYSKGYLYTLVYPLFALALIYIFQLVYSYASAMLEKQRVKSVFMKYVDPKIVDSLVDSGEADSDEAGVLKDIAVMFVDVRGFTAMSERLRPETVVQILNEYLELTSASVFGNGGSVDKFIGDATMALFNGFVPTDDYVFKAVKAAWDIVSGADKVNASIREKYGVDIGFGVGVNCGRAIVGNLGPSYRKDYTAIGDTVNVAARLESNAKRSQVLISEAVYEAVKHRVDAEAAGDMALKGKSEKVGVYIVKGVPPTPPSKARAPSRNHLS
ncbi:MAG: adenylate/guanylate cyclase domain-containing protein [Oscillospiraceae bacterium]|nr:adenylate/guanylate cyclase domain-containing protein [Oscillospiraceae bacterium]